MTVVYIRDVLQARADLTLTRSTAVPVAAADRKIPAKAEQGGAWYHQAAIVEAERVVPRRD